jgi:hypothetical protein
MKSLKLYQVKIVHDPNDTWVPYPLSDKESPAHSSCVTHHMLTLHLIVDDVTNEFFGETEKRNRRDLWNEVDKFHRRLVDWSEQLPECIAFGQKWTPAVLDLQ